MNHSLLSLIWSLLRRLLIETDAAAATEYAILLALMVLAALGAVTALGTITSGWFSSAGNEAAATAGGMTGPTTNAFGTVVSAGASAAP